ncbi:hypothetical protein [Nocardia sp. NPDC058705]|uniref:hypothetical protein n=1 Tax=Nocardia sp. NPDC058705 TaxID=3346609 RepID=UPI003687C073
MDHLTVVDEIFLRTHRGMGTPIALQGLWRTPDAMEPVLLQAIHHHLRLGPLSRRVVNPRVPGARRTWHPNTNAHPLDLLPSARHGRAEEAAKASRSSSTEVEPADSHAHSDGHTPPHGRAQASDFLRVGPLSDSEILPWADTLGTDLDPEFGPGWRLSAAYLEDCGTVVALTCSHALADARGLIHAITTALRSLGSADTDPAHDGGPAQIGPTPVAGIRSGTASSEWMDAVSQWTTILGGTARALHQRLPRLLARPSRAASFDDVPGKTRTAYSSTTGEAPPPIQGSDTTTDRSTTVPNQRTDRRLHPLLLTFDATHWNTTATTLGATPNSLFIHLIANILWHNGFPSPTITASLPVDTRDEPRVDNDLAMTEITIHRSDTPSTIRDKAKAAYQRRMSSPAGLPEEILQVVPDRLAYALSRGAGERDILCSNIGPLPDDMRKVGPHNCTRVAARAIHPGITTFPRTQLSGYLSHLGNTYTLALVSLADNDALPESVDKACAAIGLPPQPW